GGAAGGRGRICGFILTIAAPPRETAQECNAQPMSCHVPCPCSSFGARGAQDSPHFTDLIRRVTVPGDLSVGPSKRSKATRKCADPPAPSTSQVDDRGEAGRIPGAIQ